MRCRLHDQVLVVKGAAVGYIGEIVSASNVDDRDWLVEFPRSAPAFNGLGALTRGRRINCGDDELRPIRPDADPVETEREIEVVA